ncbi:MAG: glycoside hydrolase family 3 protein [Chloroflexi bacterium]|nr:glycoside hydrolase family 3 protein [Chloroflexota bacterium]
MVHETRAGTALISGRFCKFARSTVVRRGVRLHLARVVVCLIVVAGISAAPSGNAAQWVGCDAPLERTGFARSDPGARALLGLTRDWTVAQRVGHLLVVGISGTEVTPALAERIQTNAPAGVFLLGRNVRDRDQLRELTKAITAAGLKLNGGVAPLVAADFEGGSVNALRAVTGATPAASQLAGGGESGVSAQALADASVLLGLGINVNLAPVADIRPPDGGFIGTRAFATSPSAVASLSTAYARGLRLGGVISVLKHFPGHGAALGDSHDLLPVLSHDLATLDAEDLLPFANGTRSGDAGMVMVGHVLVPAVDAVRPASLSAPVIMGLLRDRLGFSGVVITDEMKMRAVSAEHSVVEAASGAIQAGADLVLGDYTPAEHAKIVDALVADCSSGRIDGERLARSLARILALKAEFALLSPEGGLSLAVWRSDALLAGRPFASWSPDAVDGRFYPAPYPTSSPPEMYTIRSREAGQPSSSDASSPGFTITDEQGIAFYRDYLVHGGPSRLGRPLSRRFFLDGEVVQLTEGGLLRWKPDQGIADVFEGFEVFQATGTPSPLVEEWLKASGYARPEDGVEAGLPDIDPGQVQVGAPRGPVYRSGGWLVQPYTRATIRKPVTVDPSSTPGGAPAEILWIGSLAKAMGAVPADALVPFKWPAVD